MTDGMPLCLVCGATEPCMTDADLKPGDPGTPCTFDPLYTWDQLDRTQDGGYWIVPEDQSPVHAFHYCMKCGVTNAPCQCGVIAAPVQNKYTQISTEPGPVYTDKQWAQGNRIAEALGHKAREIR